MYLPCCPLRIPHGRERGRLGQLLDRLRAFLLAHVLMSTPGEDLEVSSLENPSPSQHYMGVRLTVG